MFRGTQLAIMAAITCLFFTPASSAAKERPSVCIFSDIGQKFSLKRVGIMVFGNSFNTTPIESWKIDDRAYGVLKKILSKDYSPKRINLPKDAFKAVYESRELFRDTEGEILKVVKKLSADKKCDFYMHFTAGVSQAGSTNQYIGGLGVLEMQGLVNDIRFLYSLSMVKIFEGKTLDRINRFRLRTGESLFTDAIMGPHQRIKFEAHPSMEAVAKDPKTREAIWQMLSKAINMNADAIRSIKKEAEIVSRAKNEKWDPFAQ